MIAKLKVIISILCAQLLVWLNLSNKCQGRSFPSGKKYKATYNITITLCLCFEVETFFFEIREKNRFRITLCCRTQKMFLFLWMWNWIACYGPSQSLHGMQLNNLLLILEHQVIQQLQMWSSKPPNREKSFQENLVLFFFFLNELR